MSVISTVPTTVVRLPSVVKGYTNGKIPTSLMLDFDGRGPLLRIVAYGMQALHIAAWNDQIEGFAPHIQTRTVGRYRSYDAQVNLMMSRYTTTYIANASDTNYWNGKTWYLRPGAGAMSAVPGTSNHGWGAADDVAEERDSDSAPEPMSDRQLIWMRDNAPEFGFGLETRRERWHWHWVAGDTLPARAIATLRVSGVKVTGIPGFNDGQNPPPPIVIPPGTSAPTKLPAPPPPLSIGSTNSNDVRWLQQLMLDCKWYAGPVDGVFGSGTKTGVINMQRALGATEDGGYGAKTCEKLVAWLASFNKPVLIKDAPPAPLREGSTNLADVRWLQQIMLERGWYLDAVDGLFGPATAAGVKAMQRALGTTADGYYGSVTAQKLAAFIA